VGVAAQHPGSRLGHYPPDQADRGSQLGAEALHRGRGLEATDPLGALGLPEDDLRDPQQSLVELSHPALAPLSDRVPPPGRRRAGLLRDREDPAGHTPRPIADAKTRRYASGEALHRAGEDADPIRQQATVRRIVDGCLDHGGVHAQASPVNHVSLPRDRDQALQKVLEHRPIQHVSQPDQRLGVRDALPVNPAERPVDEAAPDFSLAFVEAPVVQVLEDEHPERDGRGGAEPTAARTQRRSIDLLILYDNTSTVVLSIPKSHGDDFQGVGRDGRVVSPGAGNVFFASAGCRCRFLE
jgi:hypothetical protein